jgi:hypothetical protein
MRPRSASLESAHDDLSARRIPVHHLMRFDQVVKVKDRASDNAQLL